jgi:hypothetical protein
VFNHELIKFKRFISWITAKLCNLFYFLSIFNDSCIYQRFDVMENLKKFVKFSETKPALMSRPWRRSSLCLCMERGDPCDECAPLYLYYILDWWKDRLSVHPCEWRVYIDSLSFLPPNLFPIFSKKKLSPKNVETKSWADGDPNPVYIYSITNQWPFFTLLF